MTERPCNGASRFLYLLVVKAVYVKAADPEEPDCVWKNTSKIHAPSPC